MRATGSPLDRPTRLQWRPRKRLRRPPLQQAPQAGAKPLRASGSERRHPKGLLGSPVRPCARRRGTKALARRMGRCGRTSGRPRGGRPLLGSRREATIAQTRPGLRRRREQRFPEAWAWRDRRLPRRWTRHRRGRGRRLRPGGRRMAQGRRPPLPREPSRPGLQNQWAAPPPPQSS